jgi:hypothetical protein
VIRFELRQTADEDSLSRLSENVFFEFQFDLFQVLCSVRQGQSGLRRSPITQDKGFRVDQDCQRERHEPQKSRFDSEPCSLIGSSRRQSQTAELGFRGLSVGSIDPLRSANDPFALKLLSRRARSGIGISSGRHPSSDRTDLTPDRVGWATP